MTFKKLVKSICYDDYWKFAYYRQEKFYASLSGTAFDDDGILNTYKFTNCYRVLDRTSQFLIKSVIYDKKRSPADTFFRIILFKLFNKIETWIELEKQVGEICISNYNEAHYGQILNDIKSSGRAIYSAAYIMPSGKSEFGSSVKHENNLKLISYIIKTELQHRIWELKHLKDAYNTLLSIPTLGKFLAFQYAVDLGYSEYSIFTEDQFVVAGPGAIRGLAKCFPASRASNAEWIIQNITDIQEEEFARLGLKFRHLNNRRLQLIDCQNLFCEIDKYLRVARPEFGKLGARIKQKYTQNTHPISFFLPPKWHASI